jgi:ABC-type transport system involved in multi-copper enzyme maturation permease subunit
MARALIWKQQRDFAPLAYVAVGGIVVLSALTHWDTSTTHEYGYASAARAIGTVFAISVYLGILASLVAGVGLFVEDLRTAEHEFWRSRPISVDQWFWTKYATGWSVLVVALAIPTALTAIIAWLARGAAAFPTDAQHRLVVTQAVAASLLAVSACYGTAAAVMSFVRRPVLAAALALALFLSALAGISELASRYSDHHRLIPYCWMALGIAFSVATPLVAWRRVRALAA